MSKRNPLVPLNSSPEIIIPPEHDTTTQYQTINEQDASGASISEPQEQQPPPQPRLHPRPSRQSFTQNSLLNNFPARQLPTRISQLPVSQSYSRLTPGDVLHRQESAMTMEEVNAAYPGPTTVPLLVDDSFNASSWRLFQNLPTKMSMVWFTFYDLSFMIIARYR